MKNNDRQNQSAMGRDVALAASVWRNRRERRMTSKLS